MNQRQKVVSVVGPTACGKTKRALAVAEEAVRSGEYAGADLISADSRQVYRGLEVLTGADVPVGFQVVDGHQSGRQSESRNNSSTQSWKTLKQVQGDTFPESDSTLYDDGKFSYYANKGNTIRIHGISIIEPSDEWSVAHFQKFARQVMVESWQTSRLPIVVGGTGLYHQQLFSSDPQLQIGPSQAVRERADQLSVEQLQEWLREIDHDRLEKMNESDRENPRRLVRAIEVGLVDQHDDEKANLVNPIDWSQVSVETELVTLPLPEIEKKIVKRVEERFANGAIEEVEKLLSLQLPSSAPVLSTLGVPEISKFLEGKIDAAECQKLWALHEYQYAKRQLTWWKGLI